MTKIIQIEDKDSNYQIDEYGNVNNLNTGKKLKGSITRAGYHYYRLSVKGVKYRYYTHRLVAKYFLNYNEKSDLVINHKDGNKMNNYYKNLEICTQSENVKHAYNNGLILKKEKNKIEELYLPNEIWKEIKDFPQYQISNKGRVKSLKNKEKILKPSTVNSYLQITLCNQGKTSNFLIHRLVYQTFYDIDITEKIIDHIDNNPMNNSLENLQIVSKQENILKELKKGDRLRKVVAFKNNEFIGEYYSCSEAARQLGCDSSAISKVCRGIYKQTHGYTFCYKE